MDERKLTAWKEIANRPEDEFATVTLSLYRAEFKELIDEIESLRRWKAEAIVVIDQWEEVWVAAGRPGPVGAFKAHSVRNLFLKNQPDLPKEGG